MDFSDSSWWDFPYTGRITVAYIIFYQGGPIEILVFKVVHTLEEVQKQTLSFIKVGQLTMAHMFQEQLLNQVRKVSTMQNLLQE